MVDIHGSLLALTELADAYRLSGDVVLDRKRRDVCRFIFNPCIFCSNPRCLELLVPEQGINGCD